MSAAEAGAPRRHYQLGKLLGKGSFGAVYLVKEIVGPAVPTAPGRSVVGASEGSAGKVYVMKRIKLAHVKPKESKAAYQVGGLGSAPARLPTASLPSPALLARAFSAHSRTSLRLSTLLRALALQEVRLLQRLHHEYIVTYRDSFLDKRTTELCIVMQYALPFLALTF